MSRRNCLHLLVATMAICAVAWELWQPASAAELQLQAGLPVVARCPAATGDGQAVKPRYDKGTLYCEQHFETAPQCPTTHTKYMPQPGVDRCHKVMQVTTGPNTVVPVVSNETVPATCPANQSLAIDPGSTYGPASQVDRCQGVKFVKPVLRNP